MYSIYLKAERGKPGSILIYDDLITENEYQLIDPTISKEDNSTGSLEFEVPMSNIGYNEISLYTTPIDVYVYKLGYSKTYDISKNEIDDIYWAGRVIDVNIGIENRKSVYCEGIFGFLNDSIQEPIVYDTSVSDRNLRTYIGYLLTKHNSKVSDNRKLYLGLVRPTYEDTKWYCNYDNTMDKFLEISEATGGHWRVRKGKTLGGTEYWYVDLLTDDIWENGKVDSIGVTMNESNKWMYYWVPNNDQQIEYGINLTDLNQSKSLSNIITVLYPLGKRKDKSSIEGIDEYYDITGCDTSKIPVDSSGNPVATVVGKSLISNYASIIGYFASSINFDDVTDATELMTLGLMSLTYKDSIPFEVDASVIDGSYKNRSLKPIEPGDTIQIVALKHGNFIEYMKVSAMETPLAEPLNTKFTIGASPTRSFTALNSKQNKKISDSLKYLTVKPYEMPEV